MARKDQTTKGTPDGEERDDVAVEPSTEADPTQVDDEVAVTDDAQPTDDDGRQLRTYQFPSLADEGSGIPVEVSERTQDTTVEPTGTHTKVFVTTSAEWETADKEDVHERNIRAVRQFMVSNGLRPDGSVTFSGEERFGGHPRRVGSESVALTYTIGDVVPTVLVNDEKNYDLAHVVIEQEQNPYTATEQAEYEAGTSQRVLDARRVSVGDVPGSPTNA